MTVAPPSSPLRPVAPILVALLGVAAFSAMDVAIKGAALAIGVYSALLLRNTMGTLMILPVWLAGARKIPTRRVLGLHVLRSSVNAAMATLFFVGIVRLPIAEGIALSFISPLAALYLAAVLLGERIQRRAIWASLLGLTGVGVIVASRLGTEDIGGEAAIGVAAVLASALLYAFNLVLQRQLAQLAGPAEVALFQNLVIAAILSLAAPWLLVRPDAQTLALVALGALLATLALALLAWSYARAEAQLLVPIEYTAFLWAALLGWLFFAEPLGTATLAGAALIVTGCWLGTRDPGRERTEPASA